MKLDGVWYPTVEHAYQAAKTHIQEERAILRQASTPSIAKRLGRTVTLRPDWTEQTKIETMLVLLRQKFADPTLRKRLLDTGNAALVETNTWGNVFWGQSQGQGCNHLGKLLMRVREEILHAASRPKSRPRVGQE